MTFIFFAETSNFGRNTSNFGWLIPVIYKGFTVTEVAKHWVAGGSAFKLHSKGIGERQKKGRESVWSLLFLSFPGDMFQLTFFFNVVNEATNTGMRIGWLQ
jgi:hypothetical protein